LKGAPPVVPALMIAFMLPVATPPHAIVFSSRYLTIPQMARASFDMNLVATLTINLFVILSGLFSNISNEGKAGLQCAQFCV